MTLTTALVFVLGLYLWMFVEVILHESTHLFAAKIAGFSPFAVTIGRGPLLFQRRVLGVTVRFHWFPLFGMVQARPPLIGLSWRGALFSIAGLLTDTVLLVLLLGLAGFKAGAPDVSQTSPANFFFAILALYQVVIIAANLIPSNIVAEGMTIPNDGRQFLGYVTGRTPNALRVYEKNIARYDPGFRIGDSWLMRGELPMQAILMSADQDMAAGRYAGATQKYLRIVAETSMHSAEKAFILDRIACIPVIQGEKAFLPAAEMWARQACALLPQCKTTRGTLGSILVEKGAYAEGLAMLMPLTAEDNAPIDRALASCYAAKALHRLGHTTEARGWIQTARSCGDFPGVFTRIEAELAAN